MTTVSPAASNGGTVAVPFLSYGTGARGLAMGEAYGAIASGADALFWNPAGMANDNSAEMLVNHQPMMEILKYDVGSVVVPAGPSRFGFGYTQLKSDTIDSLDTSGNPTGSFSTKDQLFVGGYARSMERWSWGVNGKYVKSDVAGASASAMAADVGLNFSNPWRENVTHALIVRNMGTPIKYGDESSALPTLLTLANGWRLHDRFNLGFDLSLPKAGSLQAALGGELKIPIRDDMGLFLRLGYGTKSSDLGAMSGLGAGGGIAFKALRLDFAWVPQNDFGSSEVFSLTWRFSSPSKASTAGLSSAAPAPSAPEKTALSVDVAKPALTKPQPATAHSSATTKKSSVGHKKRGPSK